MSAHRCRAPAGISRYGQSTDRGTTYLSDPFGDRSASRAAHLDRPAANDSRGRPLNVVMKIVLIESEHVCQKPRERRGKRLNGIVGVACLRSRAAIVISSISGIRAGEVVDCRREAAVPLSGPVPRTTRISPNSRSTYRGRNCSRVGPSRTRTCHERSTTRERHRRAMACEFHQI